MNLTQQQLSNFWNKVNKIPDGCWEWTGCLKNGYGKVTLRGMPSKDQYTHRVSWQLFNGDIENNLWVLHRCDNPKCVNPDHLFLGTHQDNMDDMIAKGRDSPTFRDPEIQRKCCELAKSPEAIAKKKQLFVENCHQQGERNSQFGTMWIHNLELQISKKINKTDTIQDGWVKGRKMFNNKGR